MDFFDIIVFGAILLLTFVPELIGASGKKKRIGSAPQAEQNPIPPFVEGGSIWEAGDEAVAMCPATEEMPTVEGSRLQTDSMLSDNCPDLMSDVTDSKSETKSEECLAAELPEEAGELQRKVIDPEKLIIYSAIMKPKFDEVLTL